MHTRLLDTGTDEAKRQYNEAKTEATIDWLEGLLV